jgi:hypothetical protein
VGEGERDGNEGSAVRKCSASVGVEGEARVAEARLRSARFEAQG